MHKQLIAAATATALSSFALTAQAADVKLYGAVDTGLTYTHATDADLDKLEMTSGNYAGPRFGVKGREDLGNGVAVGFILEAGYASDSGAQAAAGKLFNRETQVYVTGGFGTFGAGRVGAFSSGSSSLSWYWDMEPFETGYIDAGVQASQVNVWRLNSDTLYYVSSTFSGMKFGAQYSFTGASDTERGEFSDNDAFFNAALRWDGENARALAGVEWERFGEAPADGVRRDDAYNLKLAAACNPSGGPATFYLGMSYFKNYDRFSDSTWDDDGSLAYDLADGARLEGWSGFAGAKYRIGKTDLLAMVQYLDGENKNPAENSTLDADFERIIGSVGLHHHLSGRTMLYAIGSYAEGSGTFGDLKDGKAATNRFMAHVGMTHFF